MGVVRIPKRSKAELMHATRLREKKKRMAAGVLARRGAIIRKGILARKGSS